jgi:hypothetical protein
MTPARILTLAVLALLAACTAPTPTAPTRSAPTPVPTPTDAAMTAYREFWTVTDAARAAPKAQDWTPRIQALAAGQALQTALTDVRNYASLPAHTTGTITRAPTVERSTDRRVEVLDCVDLGDSRLVSDGDGRTLDDLQHRVQRFHLRAAVEAGPDGRWLVTKTTPALAEPC